MQPASAKKVQQVSPTLTKLAVGLLMMSASAEAFDKEYWRQVHQARKSAVVTSKQLMDSTGGIIIDTRCEVEREEYDFEPFAQANNQQYIVVDYDNFYKADRFFHSFVASSEWYNSENDGQDVNIFGLPDDFDFSVEPLELPEDAAAKGSDITLICGKRSCACRWKLMYQHGVRGHSYLNADVNLIIDFLNYEEEE